jgi:cyclase
VITVLKPHRNILAFYSGREPGKTYMPQRNWVDEGALSVGIASYAIVSGDEALVYDTHVSVDHAREVRRVLETQGVKKFTVLLSHWHLDHIAGTEAFADCKVWANAKTAGFMRKHKHAIETATHDGPPTINPLILPTDIFEGEMRMQIGDVSLHIIEANIHSPDESLVLMEKESMMLVGDALEDSVTFVSDAPSLPVHLREIDRMKKFGAQRLLPNHGAAQRIDDGGYDQRFWDATSDYIGTLLRMKDDPALAQKPVREVIAPWLANGTLTWFDGYEAVHSENLAQVKKANYQL